MPLSSSLGFRRIIVFCVGLLTVAIAHAQLGTGELGSFNFDGANPTSGLVATGAPAISTLNNHTPPNSLSFPAGNNYESYTLPTATSVLYTRQYVYISSTGSTSNAFLRLYNGSSELMSIFLSASTGNPSYYNQATGVTTTISSTPLSTGTIHLVEFYFKMSATAGQVICKIDSTTVYTSAATLNTGASAINTVWFGQIGNTAPVGWGTTYMDNVDFSAIGWIGPISPNLGTGELGSFNFDGANPTSGLVATGAPAISILNNHTPPNSLSFPAGNNYESYTLPTATSVLYTRQYIDISSIGSTSNAFLRLYHSGNELMSIFLDASAGHPSYYSQASGVTTTISSTPLSTGTIHLVEFYFNMSATTGQVICKIDGTTVYTSAATLNTGNSTIDTVWFGQVGNTAPIGWGTTYMDNVDFSAIGWIGPINVAAAPVLSPAPGAYTAAQTVSLTDATTGASIYYTTDGSTPTNSSSLYSQAITVGSTETVQAIAIASSYANSAVTGGTYTIVIPPTVSALSPTSGVVGTSVTISGSNFGASQGTSTVSFNGTTATPSSWSATSIVVPVPAGATTGNVVVTVGGISSNGSLYTVVLAPSINGLSPSSGAVTTLVTISGSYFGASQGSSTVNFNGTSATPASWSDSSIVVSVPAGATTGNVVVIVSGSSSNGVSFTVIPTPAISGLSPTSGAVGTSVTISGSNFGASQGTSTVSFNGTSATPTSWSASSIVVPVPAGASTGDVQVTVGGIGSNSLLFTVFQTPCSQCTNSPNLTLSCTPTTVTPPQTAVCTAKLAPTAIGAVSMGTYAGDTIAVQPDETGAATQANVLVSAATGSYTYTAVFPGDNYYAPASASVTLTVQTGTTPSNLVLTCSPVAPGGSQPATCGAQLPSGSTGYVVFVSTAFHVFVPINSSGQAIISTPFVGIPQGSYDVVASYGGDGTYAASSGSATVLVDSGTPTSESLPSQVSISCNPSTVMAPQTASCMAQVTTGATGTVTISYGQFQTTVPVDGVGDAAAYDLFVGAAGGAYTVTAAYSGDRTYAASSATTSVTVVQAGTNPGTVPDMSPPTIAMTCQSPINLNGSAECKAWVSPGATGYVTYYSSATGRTIAEPIDASGNTVAPNEVSNVPAGSYYVAAGYGGDQTYAGNWTFVGVTVQNNGPTAPNMTVSCSPDLVAPSETTTCTAQVPTAATGSVSFTLGGTALGTASVNSLGQATISAAVPAATGTYTLTASYGGDANFSAATAQSQVAVTTSGGDGSGTGTPANCNVGTTAIYGYVIVDSQGNPGYAPNSDVTNYCDTVMGAWSASYDGLDRLQSASVTGGPYDGMSLAWNIDTFGNRLLQTPSVHLPPQTTPGLTFNNALNHADQFSYDSAGNVTNDGINAYLYDGANRICAVNSSGTLIGYLYDAEGRRVAKGTLSQFSCDITSNGFTLSEQSVLGQSGEQLGAIEQNSGTSRINVFAQGKLLGTYDSNVNGFQFAFNDWLGTKRVQYSLVQGAATETCSSLLYGDSLSCNGFDATDHHYTGKERDAESGNDYFGARYYASSMGRFMSPDSSDGPDPVPFADISDPQSLNLYSYVENNPLSGVDYDGHSTDCGGGGDPSLVCLVSTAIDKIKDFFSGSVTTSQQDTINTTPAPPGVPEGGPGTTTGPLIEAQDAARSNPRFQPIPGGPTFCNMASCYIGQHVPGTNMGPLMTNGIPNLANTDANTLAHSGAYHQVSRAEAQRLANAGKVVFGVYKETGHGHIVTVRPDNGPFSGGGPSTNPNDPLINDIGRHIGVYPLSQQPSAGFRAGVIFYAQN